MIDLENLTDAQLDEAEGIVREKIFKLAFERAKQEMDNRIDKDKSLIKAVSKMPKTMKIGGEDHYLEAVFDQTEYFWLCEQYGGNEFLDDDDFMHFYRKHRDQLQLEVL